MKQLKTPYLGVAYYPEDWPESELDKDIARMTEIGINVIRIGEFAWHRMEPTEGKFDFSFFHKVVDKAREAGIGVVLGTPTATPPRWLTKQYPEVLTIAADGHRAEHGGRRHCCSNNPTYGRYCMRIVEQMAREFADDPAVIGWQIDNEIYAWGGCFCPHCVTELRRYLKNLYGTIDALNEAWNLNLFSQWYDSFDDIPAPHNAWHNPHLIQAWSTFQNDSHIAFVHRQAEILHRYVKVPVGTDTMPFNGMDYRRMTAPLDIVQFNHYNTPEDLHCAAFWFDYLRTLKEHPFWNTETATCWNGSTAITQSVKPEGYCVVNSWLPVALGGEANMYWLWRTHWAGHELMHGAVIDTSGRDIHTVGEVRSVAEGFERAGEFLSKTRVKSDFAIHFTSLNWNMHAQQPVVVNWDYMSTLQEKLYRPAAEMGLRPDVIDAAQALDGVRLLFSPMMMSMEEADLKSRVTEWVRNGGVWVVGPLSDVRTADGARYRDRYYGFIEELTGVKWQYFAPDTDGNIKAQWADGTPFRGETWFEMSEPCDGTLVSVTGGHSAFLGRALVCEKRVGKGTVIVLGSVPSHDDAARLVKYACEKAGVDVPCVEGEVMRAPRVGEGVSGCVYVEYGAKEAFVTLSRPMLDVLSGETAEGRIRLAPYSVRVLKDL